MELVWMETLSLPGYKLRASCVADTAEQAIERIKRDDPCWALGEVTKRKAHIGKPRIRFQVLA